MFDIYIKNYTAANGAYQTAEQLLYSIPMDPEEPNVLVNPKVTGDMGKAGSLEFGMNVGHPYYNSLCQMKTIFRIVYDGDTIFRGRVLTIDANHLTGVKNVHCEGDLAFFLDSQIQGLPDDKRPKTDALTYINQLLSSHNSQMAIGMPDKQFILGEVPGHYSAGIEGPQKLNPDANYAYGSGSWRDTQSALNELSDSFGGFFRTRYQNGSVYVDWLDGYYRNAINDQAIELGENLIDISSNTEVNNIFTALIPIGSKNGKQITIEGYRTEIHGNNNYILVPDLLKVYSDAELNTGVHTKEDYQKSKDDYDVIYHVEQFGNADTQEKLWNYALDWIKNNYIGGLSSFTISALDMHMLGNNVGKYLVGDRVPVRYPDVDRRSSDPEAMIDKTMTMMGAVYDLHHPEKNQYKIGIPNAILKKNYGTKKTKKSSSGGAGSKEQKTQQEEFIDENWKTYESNLIWEFVIDGVHNNEEYEAYKNKYGTDAADAVQKMAYLQVGNLANKVPGYQHGTAKMILDGEKGTMEFSGPINQQAMKFAQETGDAVRSIMLNGTSGEFDIRQPLPTAALNWTSDKLKAFNNSVAKITAGGTSATLTMNKITGQSVTDVGKETVSAFVDSFTGGFGGVKQQFAKSIEDVEKVRDGNALSTIELNGPEALLTAGDGEQTNIELSGIFGTGNFGKDRHGSWQVKANDSVTYTDASGVVHTSEPGFVTANDFAAAGANEIPSFKTQVAVIKSLIADKAFIVDLRAVNAKIDKITGGSIIADTVVRAALISGNVVQAPNGTVTGKNVYGSNLGFSDSEGAVTYLHLRDVKIGNTTQQGRLVGSVTTDFVIPNAVTGFGESSESGGKINIPYYTYDSGATKAGDINFNIADTATYKAAVGIKSTGSWVWSEDEGNYIRTVQANNSTSEPIYLPTIDATAGTPSGGKVRVNVTGPEGHVITYEDVTITGGNIKALETVNASTSSQTILPPSGYDGFAKIIVNPAPLRNYTGDSKITTNGTYTAGSSYYGIGTVVVDTPTTGGISTVVLNGPGSSAYSGEDKGTLERNKYYQVVATPNSGDAVSIRFKTAASSASATFTSVNSLPSGKTATNLRKGYLYKFTFIRDGTTVTANYYKCPA